MKNLLKKMDKKQILLLDLYDENGELTDTVTIINPEKLFANIDEFKKEGNNKQHEE